MAIARAPPRGVHIGDLRRIIRIRWPCDEPHNAYYLTQIPICAPPLGVRAPSPTDHFRQHAGNIVQSSCLINPSNSSRVSVQTPGYIYLSSSYSWPLPPKWINQTLSSRPLLLPLRPSSVPDIVFLRLSSFFEILRLHYPILITSGSCAFPGFARRLHYQLFFVR